MQKETLQKLFERCPDVLIRSIGFGKESETHEVVFVYCESLCDAQRIEEIILPRLHRVFEEGISSKVEEVVPQLLSLVSMEQSEEQIVQSVFNGNLLLLFTQSGQLFEMGISKRPNRSVQETNTEVSIRGPRDGFIEDLQTNIALIRKRLRTPTLTYEQFIVGRRSKTPVVLMYMTDIASDRVIRQVRERIQQIDVDMLASIEMLGKMVANVSYRFFPVFVYTGRPDFATDGLVNGRFVILVDGEPTCIIGPVELLFLLKTAEDNSIAPVFVMVERFIRFLGLFFAIFLPGFWTALVVYQQDQLPYRMLATLTIARQGVPLPAGVESFLMLFLFELFREAGARMPKVVGQTLSVVGGLIIGDAAIGAGLASPAQVVVVATSVVATSTLVHHSLTGTAVLMRMLVLIVSSVLGMYGVVLSFITMVVILTNIESFGVPYLSSINYKSLRQMIAAVFYLPFHELRKRPKFLRLKDETSGGGEK